MLESSNRHFYSHVVWFRQVLNHLLSAEQEQIDWISRNVPVRGLIAAELPQ